MMASRVPPEKARVLTDAGDRSSYPLRRHEKYQSKTRRISNTTYRITGSSFSIY
jgi:5-deoxy-D-glucuronate isomerase